MRGFAAGERIDEVQSITSASGQVNLHVGQVSLVRRLGLGTVYWVTSVAMIVAFSHESGTGRGWLPLPQDVVCLLGQNHRYQITAA